MLFDIVFCLHEIRWRLHSV